MANFKEIYNTALSFALSALCGALCGGFVGAIYGAFFMVPIIGSIFGVVPGAYAGCIAGLIGVVINHRVGCKIGGLAGSLLLSFDLWHPINIHELSYDIWLFVIPAALAVFVGSFIDKDMDEVEPSSRFFRGIREGQGAFLFSPYCWLRKAFLGSTMIRWSASKRIVWACLIFVIFLIPVIQRY